MTIREKLKKFIFIIKIEKQDDDYWMRMTDDGDCTIITDYWHGDIDGEVDLPWWLIME